MNGPQPAWSWTPEEVVGCLSLLEETRNLFEKPTSPPRLSFLTHRISGRAIFKDILTHAYLTHILGVDALGDRIMIRAGIEFLQQTFPGYDIWTTEQNRRNLGLPPLFTYRSDTAQVAVEFVVPEQAQDVVQGHRNVFVAADRNTEIGPRMPNLMGVHHPDVSRHIPVPVQEVDGDDTSFNPLVIEFGQVFTSAEGLPLVTRDSQEYAPDGDATAVEESIDFETESASQRMRELTISIPNANEEDGMDVDSGVDAVSPKDRHIAGPEASTTSKGKSHKRRRLGGKPYLKRAMLSAHEIFYGVMEDSDEEETWFLEKPFHEPGTSQYVYQRLVHLFNEAPLAGNDTSARRILRPFPRRYLRRCQKWPVTVFEADGRIVRSENIKAHIEDFPFLAPEFNQKHGLKRSYQRTSHSNSDRILLTDMNDPIDRIWINPYQAPYSDDALNDMEARWSGLANEILPPFGESGSEGSDPETMKQLEREKKSRMRKKRIRENDPLNETEMDAAIDFALHTVVDKWRSKAANSTVRATKAYHLWHRSRKNGERSLAVQEYEERIEELDSRLLKQRSEIKMSPHFSDKSISRLVRGNMIVTVQDKEENLWSIAVLQGPKPAHPEKPLRMSLDPEDLIDEDGSGFSSELSGYDDAMEGGDDFLVGDDVFDKGFEHLNDELMRDDAQVPQPQSEVDMDEDVESRALVVYRQSSPVSVHTNASDAGNDNSESRIPTRRRTSKQPSATSSDKEDVHMSSPRLAEPTNFKAEQTTQTVRNLSNVSAMQGRAASIIDLTDDALYEKSNKQKSVKKTLKTIHFSSREHSREAEASPSRQKSTASAYDPIVIEEDDDDEQMQVTLLAGLKDITSQDNEQSSAMKSLQDNLKQLDAEDVERMVDIASITPKDLLPTLSECFEKLQADRSKLKIPGVSSNEKKSAYLALARLYASFVFGRSLADFRLIKRADRDKLRNLNNLEHFIRVLRRMLRSTKPEELKSSQLSISTSQSKQSKPRKVLPVNLKTVQLQAMRTKEEQLQKSRQISRARKGIEIGDQALLNIGHRAKYSAVYLPNVWAKTLQPHQIDGVRFLWDQLVGFEGGADDRHGALLAHTMGMGKTVQVIILLYMIATTGCAEETKYSSQIPLHLRTSRTLIVAPPGLLQNWQEEFRKWLHQDTIQPDVLGGISMLQSGKGDISSRLEIIEKWHNEGGILLCGYDMFRNCATAVKKYDKKLAETPGFTGILDDQEQSHHNDLKSMQQMLYSGPNIVVADEAHIIKKQTSQISRVMQNFKTKSRIAMTGSPLANNMGEYWAIIDWIHKDFLGPWPEFKYEYEFPINEGLYIDSSQVQQRRSLVVLASLRKVLRSKMHRKSITEIKDQLPKKTEFLISLPLTPLQKKIYQKYVDQILLTRVEGEEWKGFLDFCNTLGALLSHPAIFLGILNDRIVANEKKAKKRDLIHGSVEEGASEPPDEDVGLHSPPSPIDDGLNQNTLAVPAPEIASDDPRLENLIGKVNGGVLSKIQPLIEQMKDLESIDHSYRMRALVDLLQHCIASKEKILIFTRSIPTLKFIQKILNQQGIVFSEIQGTTPISKRQGLCAAFNKGDGGQVFLISTEAGGLGLNLYGASRVFIFDFGWSPQAEEQAVGRAYRIGQNKHVFVYRFKVAGTWEDVLHNRTVFKMQLASRVVDQKDPSRVAQKNDIGMWFKPPTDAERGNLGIADKKDPAVLERVLDQPYVLDIVLTETYEAHQEELLTAEEAILANEYEQKFNQLRKSTRLQTQAAQLSATRNELPLPPQAQAQAGSGQVQAPMQSTSPAYPPGNDAGS